MWHNVAGQGRLLPVSRVSLLRLLRAKCAVLLALVAFLAPALAGSLGTLCISPEHLGFDQRGGCCCESRPEAESAQSQRAAPPGDTRPAAAPAPCDDPCCSTPAHCPCIDVPSARDPFASIDRRTEPLPSRQIVAVITADALALPFARCCAEPPPLPPPQVRVIPPPRNAVLRC